MSTPSITILRNRERNCAARDVEVARIYRHYDGYPTWNGMGGDICAALLRAAEAGDRAAEGEAPWEDTGGDINERNWAQHFLRELLSTDADMELVAPGTTGGNSVNLVYVVTGRHDRLLGKPRISGAEYLARVEVEVVDTLCHGQMKRTLFKGSPEELSAWLDRRGN